MTASNAPNATLQTAGYRPTPGVYAPNTGRAMERLEKGKPGDAVTESEMAAVIGEACGTDMPGYDVVSRAAKYVLRNSGIYWQRDRTVPGWRCLDPNQRVKYVSEHGAKRIRHLARKNIQILGVNPLDLTPELARDQQILQVAHGMIHAATRKTFRKQIAMKVADWQRLKQPTDSQIIALMQENHNGK